MSLFSLNTAREYVGANGNVTGSYFNIFLLLKNYLQRPYIFSIFRKKFKVKAIFN